MGNGLNGSRGSPRGIALCPGYGEVGLPGRMPSGGLVVVGRGRPVRRPCVNWVEHGATPESLTVIEVLVPGRFVTTFAERFVWCCSEGWATGLHEKCAGRQTESGGARARPRRGGRRLQRRAPLARGIRGWWPRRAKGTPPSEGARSGVRGGRPPRPGPPGRRGPHRPHEALPRRCGPATEELHHNDGVP